MPEKKTGTKLHDTCSRKLSPVLWYQILRAFVVGIRHVRLCIIKPFHIFQSHVFSIPLQITYHIKSVAVLMLWHMLFSRRIYNTGVSFYCRVDCCLYTDHSCLFVMCRQRMDAFFDVILVSIDTEFRMFCFFLCNTSCPLINVMH